MGSFFSLSNFGCSFVYFFFSSLSLSRQSKVDSICFIYSLFFSFPSFQFCLFPFFPFFLFSFSLFFFSLLTLFRARGLYFYFTRNPGLSDGRLRRECYYVCVRERERIRKRVRERKHRNRIEKFVCVESILKSRANENVVACACTNARTCRRDCWLNNACA